MGTDGSIKSSVSIQYPSWASDRCVTVHRGHRREGAPPLPKPWLPSLQTAFLKGCHSSSSRCTAGKETRQAVCHSGSWKRSVFLCIHRERLTHCSWEAPRDEAHCFCLENGLGTKRMTSLQQHRQTGTASCRGGKEGDNGHRWAKSLHGPHCGHGATPGEWEPHSAPQITPQPQYSTIQTHSAQHTAERRVPLPTFLTSQDLNGAGDVQLTALCLPPAAKEHKGISELRLWVISHTIKVSLWLTTARSCDGAQCKARLWFNAQALKVTTQPPEERKA